MLLQRDIREGRIECINISRPDKLDKLSLVSRTVLVAFHPCWSNMVQITGKYTRTKEEKYEDFLSKLNVGFLTRKAAMASTPTMDITENGGKWKMVTSTTLKSIVLEFELVKWFGCKYIWFFMPKFLKGCWIWRKNRRWSWMQNHRDQGRRYHDYHAKSSKERPKGCQSDP